MKISKLFAASLLALAISTPAFADAYVGLDASNVSVAQRTGSRPLYPQSLNGVGAHVGYKFATPFAVELGAQTVSGVRSSNSTSLTLNSVNVDAFAFYPVTQTISLVGTGGVLYTGADGKASSAKLFHSDLYDWRAGAGAQFKVTDGFNVRLLARYEPLALDRRANHAVTSTLSLNFGL